MTTGRRKPWFGLVLALVACSDEASTATGPAASATPSALPAPVPPPPYGPGPWARASAGDVQAHRRLAELHDGERLGAWAKRGPRAGIALEALVYAEDAELAFGALAEILAEQPERRAVVLDVVYRLALRPPRSTEPLDPPGHRRLIERVQRLATEAPPGLVRSRARSAWRAFARAGYVQLPPP